MSPFKGLFIGLVSMLAFVDGFGVLPSMTK